MTPVKNTANSHLRGKVSYFDYDAMLDLSDDTCLFCLSERDVQLILASLEPIAWKRRWISEIDTPVSQDTIDGWQVSIQEHLMSDVCAQIMNKLNDIKTLLDGVSDVVDGTQTEVSIIGGEITEIAAQQLLDSAVIGEIAAQQAIDSAAIAGLVVAAAATAGALAGIATNVTEIGDDVDNIETILTDSTNGLVEVSQDVDNLELLVVKMKSSVTNVFNNSTTINVENYLTFGSTSVDNTQTELYARYNALCSAVQAWVLLEGYAVLDALGASTSDLGSIELLIAVAYFNIAATLSVAGSYTYDATTVYAALVDSSAVNDVACAIIQKLSGLPVTYDSFTQALNSYTPPAYPDHRYILTVTLANAVTYLDGYTALVSMLQDEFTHQLSLAPTSYTCAPCDPVFGYQTWDFTLGQKAPWLIMVGQLVLGAGILSQQVFVSGQGYHSNSRIVINLPGTLTIQDVYCNVLDTNDLEGRSATGAQRNFHIDYTYLLAGVPTTVSPTAITTVANATTTCHIHIAGGGLALTKIEIYSANLYVWKHYILNAQIA